MRRLLPWIALSLITVVVILAWQNGKNGGDDEGDPVELMPDQFIRDSLRIRVGDEMRWVHFRIGTNRGAPVFTGDLNGAATGLPREEFERRFRWAQILIVAPRSDPRDLPRYDAGMTGREAAAAPAGDPNRRERAARTASHDPFQRAGTLPPHKFHDSPTTDKWESYVILFEITESGGNWTAAIVKVWHWTFDSLRTPKDRVAPVDPSDDAFEEALRKAGTEFGGGFAPGTPYPAPVPPTQ